MVRKKPEGVKSLVQLEPIALDKMNMLDFFAAFVLMGLAGGEDMQENARMAYDQAEEMMLERMER